MPFTDTFLLATNTSLTLEFGGYEDLIHNTDESDNPQDLAALYLGSVNSTRTLKATSNPGVDNITLTPTDILPMWVLSTAYVLNQRAQPTTPNGYVYSCTTAGTSSATEPTWPTSINSTVADGSAVWTCVSTKHEITEITLALTNAVDLDTNTPGAPLSLGTSISGGTSNKKTIYIRVENDVNIVGNNTSYPDIAIVLNGVTEY